MGLSVVTGYALYLLTLTMTYAADDFGVGTTGQGVGLAVARADLLLASPLLAVADRRGRKPALLVATTGACLVSAATALAPTFPAFVGAQVVLRACGTAALILIGIVVATPAMRGRLGAIGALIYGSSLIGFVAAEWVINLVFRYLDAEQITALRAGPPPSQ